jgi:aspartate/methionine/tyrosine aminotransferase
LKLPDFALDQWLEHAASPAIRYDLASSTGPVWRLREILDFLDPASRERFLDTDLVYAPGRGSAALRESVAEALGASPEHVQIVNGATEGLLVLFFDAAEAGGNIVIPDLGFPPFADIPRSLGLEVRTYRLRRETGFGVDPGEVGRLLDGRTRFLLVNSPHGPTGAVLFPGALRELYDVAVRAGVPFVSDEVYHPVYYGAPGGSAASFPGATVLGDLSKALSVAGLRTGWILEPDPARRARFLNARAYFTISNSPVTEFLASAVLASRGTILARAQEAGEARLRLLDSFFERHREVLGWVRPRGGFTTFPWLRSGEDARPLCHAFKDRGVLVAPGDCWGRPEHFRLGFGSASAEFPKALEALSGVLEGSRHGVPLGRASA